MGTELRGYSIQYCMVPALFKGHKTEDRKQRIPYWSAAPRQASIGEIMFLREAWLPHLCPGKPREEGKIVYAADGLRSCPECKGYFRFLSSTSMISRLSRALIKITGVRTGILQEISPEECEREGLRRNEYGLYTFGFHRGANKKVVGSTDPVEAFGLTWDWMYAENGPYWDDKDWAVWVFTIQLIKTRVPVINPADILNFDEVFKKREKWERPKAPRFRDDHAEPSQGKP